MCGAEQAALQSKATSTAFSFSFFFPFEIEVCVHPHSPPLSAFLRSPLSRSDPLRGDDLHQISTYRRRALRAEAPAGVSGYARLGCIVDSSSRPVHRSGRSRSCFASRVVSTAPAGDWSGLRLADVAFSNLFRVAPCESTVSSRGGE
jgi:hypothetical protein